MLRGRIPKSSWSLLRSRFGTSHPAHQRILATVLPPLNLNIFGRPIMLPDLTTVPIIWMRFLSTPSQMRPKGSPCLWISFTLCGASSKCWLWSPGWNNPRAIGIPNLPGRGFPDPALKKNYVLDTIEEIYCCPFEFLEHFSTYCSQYCSFVIWRHFCCPNTGKSHKRGCVSLPGIMRQCVSAE